MKSASLKVKLPQLLVHNCSDLMPRTAAGTPLAGVSPLYQIGEVDEVHNSERFLVMPDALSLLVRLDAQRKNLRTYAENICMLQDALPTIERNLCYLRINNAKLQEQCWQELNLE